MKKRYLIIFMIIFATSSLFVLYEMDIFSIRVYYASDFDIANEYSGNDKNKDEIDDLEDILYGARIAADNGAKYVDKYYAGGYPPDDEGVCTDLIWRSLMNAGYMLKDMIDEDIKNNIEDYNRVSVQDTNIDFRRVKNLKVFFDKYYMKCTVDPYDIEAWQGGDIVIFGEDYCHIGIISDKRNRDGICYLIHNAGQKNREEDKLIKWHNMHSITAHYRFIKTQN